MGLIAIDDFNNQVVIDSKSVYNIYDAKENPLKLFLVSVNNGNKMCIELQKSNGFESFNIYYFVNNRFEFNGNYKILDLRMSEKEPWIDTRNPDFLIPLKSLIINGEFGRNPKLFESDVWFMDFSVNKRINIISKYLKNEIIRAKNSMGNDFTISYNDYSNFNDMINKGEYDKLINYLDMNNVKSAQVYLYRLGISLSEYLYYYDNQSKKWKDYMSE